MPNVIDYPIVLRRLESEGLKCHYPNGGSFGFPAGGEVRGWVGPADETIRPEMKGNTRSVNEPFEANLVEWASRAWGRVLPGNVWVMPASHWSFELTHGNQQWLPGLLAKVGVDSGLLIGRTDATTIEFLPSEDEGFRTLLGGLLRGLTGSDFTLTFPGRKTVCTVHHHKQLWWVSDDQQVVRGLDEIG
jgi:hypothetical protein